MFYGHQRTSRNLERVKWHFHWHRLAEDVCLFIDLCGPCGLEKKATRRNKAPLQSYTAGVPMDRILIDVLGPLSDSTSGSKYVLIIIDQFSKLVQTSGQ